MAELHLNKQELFQKEHKWWCGMSFPEILTDLFQEAIVLNHLKNWPDQDLLLCFTTAKKRLQGFFTPFQNIFNGSQRVGIMFKLFLRAHQLNLMTNGRVVIQAKQMLD